MAVAAAETEKNLISVVAGRAVLSRGPGTRGPRRFFRHLRNNNTKQQGHFPAVQVRLLELHRRRSPVVCC